MTVYSFYIDLIRIFKASAGYMMLPLLHPQANKMHPQRADIPLPFQVGNNELLSATEYIYTLQVERMYILASNSANAPTVLSRKLNITLMITVTYKNAY